MEIASKLTTRKTDDDNVELHLQLSNDRGRTVHFLSIGVNLFDAFENLGCVICDNAATIRKLGLPETA